MGVRVRLIALLGGLGLAGALTLPYLTAADGDQRLWLLRLPAAFVSAGGGPFRGLAVIAAGCAVLLVVALVVGLVLALLRVVRPGAPVRGWERPVVVVVVLAGIGAWLLQLMLVAQWDGRPAVLTPGLVAMTLGVAGLAVATWLATRR